LGSQLSWPNHVALQYLTDDQLQQRDALSPEAARSLIRRFYGSFSGEDAERR
jgi:hypothetical protein